MTTYQRPPNDSHDWAAVCRWEDAGRPPINPDELDAPHATDNRTALSAPGGTQ